MREYIIDPKKIGFHTLTKERALKTAPLYHAYMDGDISLSCIKRILPIWRTEVLITTQCNFNCSYCRGETPYFNGGHIPFESLKKLIDIWYQNRTQNIRLSGGEPFTHPRIFDILEYINSDCYYHDKIIASYHDKMKVAISTNGSMHPDVYMKCIEHDYVYDWSISLDGCCSKDINTYSGTNLDIGQRILDNIEMIAKYNYITVGVVLTPDNINKTIDIIYKAHELGVSDIRLISAAQWKNTLELSCKIDNEILEKYPILRYRLENIENNIPVRGLSESDSKRCYLLMSDEMVSSSNNTLWSNPCIISAREGSEPISTIEEMRLHRLRWVMKTNTHEIKQCRENCLDVCRDFNNSVKYYLHKGDKNE